jgi:hypothetical protein
VKLRNLVLGLSLLGAVALTGCGGTDITSTPAVGATVTVAETPAAAGTPTTAMAAETPTTAMAAETPTTAMAAETATPPLATATTAAGGATTPVAGATTPATGAGTPTAATDPKAAVDGFLTSLQSQPDGSAGRQYLSSLLQLRLDSGKTVAAILGVQNMYQSFQTEAPVMNEAGTGATVRATLNYAAGPEVRLFSLNKDGDNWVINVITPEAGSGAATTPAAGAAATATP